jgi:hypothetical protein
MDASERSREWWIEHRAARDIRRGRRNDPRDVAESLKRVRIVSQEEIDRDRDPEVEAALALPPPEDTRALLRLYAARRAARALEAERRAASAESAASE